jgi:hypothetical protein
VERKLTLTALAGAAMILAAPAVAQRGPGGGAPGAAGGHGNAGGFGAGGSGGFGGGLSGGFGAGMGNGGMGNIGNVGSTMRDQGRSNSQGAANASATGIAHANENSVLAGTTATTSVTSGVLAGLTTGTTLYSNGTAVGTVQQIRTTGRGSVAVVVVKGTNGGLYAVPASKLTWSGGTLSTSARLQGVNSSTTTASNQGRVNSQGAMYASPTGIAHANQHSVLYGSSTTASTNVRGNAQARINSQGAMHASATGSAHANQHSVLYGGSTGTTTSNISVGMALVSSTGAQLGTVYRVVTANGTVRRVLVQGTNGRMYSLAPNTLTASSSGSLTTTTNLRGM